jgi:predicted small lipoprotein YifL
MSLRTFIRTGAVLLILGGPLAACGKLGELEAPGASPKGGNASDRQAEEQRRQAQDPQRPVDTVDPRDRTTDPAPPRTLPIDGSGQDPNAQPPQGALGNPFANPR